jgi:hypothetical protein
MTDLIVITKKTVRARDLRVAVGGCFLQGVVAPAAVQAGSRRPSGAAIRCRNPRPDRRCRSGHTHYTLSSDGIPPPSPGVLCHAP